MRAEPGPYKGSRLAAGPIAAAVWLLSFPLAAGEPPQLAFPVDCVPGKSCWLYQYVDVEPGASARDYTCGHRSYDGHKGTDIALADVMAMERGVTVLAAADGRVRNIRDGEPDRLPGEAERDGVDGRECGNGVAVQHGGGWETMYCHMRNGSIRVRPGERVSQGQPLGLIGLSGNTQFPHLHFGVRHGDAVVDPFRGVGPHQGCGESGTPLWNADSRSATHYSPVDIYQIGAAAEAPQPEAAYAGELNAATLQASAPALVAWTTIAAVRAGDRLTVRLLSPTDGVIAESETALNKDQIRYFAYAGRRRTEPEWPTGEYRVEVQLVRKSGAEPVERSASRIITVR